MTLSPADVVELTNDVLLPAFFAERQRLDEIDRWYRWDPTDPVLPPGASPEKRALLHLSRTPWLRQVVTGVAQGMRLNGYRTPENNDDLPMWATWKRNGLDGWRQAAIWRAMLGYGRAYGTVLPGADPLTGEPMAVMRGVSPRKMLAFWADPAEDEYPMFAIRAEPQRRHWLLRVYDAEAEYHLTTEVPAGSAAKVLYLEDRRHDVGVCPVVQFSNVMDLDGRTDGEVEPLIPLAKRINKTTFDRLLIQHYNSWKVKWATGLERPDDAEAANLRLRLSNDDILINESPDGSFGTLPETSLDGILKAYESDIRTLAAASQTAVHALTGDLINLSADALAAAKAEAEAKKQERQQSAGPTAAKWLRLAAHVQGDAESAANYLGEATWADTSVRSLSTAADALGKIATMLGVPAEALWDRIPGVTKTDVAEWKAIIEARPGGMAGLMAELAARQTSGLDAAR